MKIVTNVKLCCKYLHNVMSSPLWRICTHIFLGKLSPIWRSLLKKFENIKIFYRNLHICEVFAWKSSKWEAFLIISSQMPSFSIEIFTNVEFVLLKTMFCYRNIQQYEVFLWKSSAILQGIILQYEAFLWKNSNFINVKIFYWNLHQCEVFL